MGSVATTPAGTPSGQPEHATAAVYQHIQQHCNRSQRARIIDSLLEGELLPPLSLELLTRMGQGIP